MLLRIGIFSTMRLMKPEADKLMPDGKGGSKEYHCQDCYELIITSGDLVRFHEAIGFCNTKKNERLKAIIAGYKRGPYRNFRCARVVSIEADSYEDVYDIQVPGVNVFNANGIIVGNCGELPLLAYESCNLGSINLANFVLTPYTKDAEFDHERLAMVAKWAVRFLDNVITANNYPLEEIQTASLASRKIGLGVMGFADTLIEMGIPYDTEAAMDALDVIMHTVHDAAVAASEALAAERGPFPGCTLEKPRRNATLTAVAPTGSISMIANVTGGIEPLFSVAMKRKAVLDGVPFMQLNDTVVELLKVNQYKDHQIADIVSELWCGKSFATATGGYKGLYRSVVCAHEVPPSIHVQMQATAQRWSDSAVSKTVNLPNDATKSDVYSVFLEAYQSGCKGITAYRSDSREDQPMNAADGKSADTVDVRQTKAKRQHVEYGKDFSVPVGTVGEVEIDAEGNETGMGMTSMTPEELAKLHEWVEQHNGAGITIKGLKLKPKERPQVLSGHTVKMQTGCGTLYVTINVDAAGNLTELFASHGKAGVCSQAQCEAIGRLGSMSLRAGVDPQAVINQLRGITCHETAGMGPSKVLSCADGIAKAIVLALEKTGVQVQAEQVVEADDKADDPNATRKTVPVFSGACPDCGAGTIREAGCVVCKACGWNKCS
jgi:ribonucleoside-diphosphate reductase alpha chain